MRDDHRVNHRDFKQACTVLKNRYTTYTDESILVQCQSGVSRSITVTTAVLAQIKDRDFAEMLDAVQQVRGVNRSPDPTLEALAANYAGRS